MPNLHIASGLWRFRRPIKPNDAPQCRAELLAEAERLRDSMRARRAAIRERQAQARELHTLNAANAREIRKEKHALQVATAFIDYTYSPRFVQPDGDDWFYQHIASRIPAVTIDTVDCMAREPARERSKGTP